MPKLKRTSENQITKDTYDRGEAESRFPEEPDPGFGMTRADPKTMKGRRIVRGRKPAAPSSSAPPKAPAATNAFASTKLVANDAPSPSTSSNPFAKVQLNSGTTAPPSFSFGAAPKAEPKPFSFGPSTSQQQPSSKKSSSLPSSKPKVKNTAQIEQINKNFFLTIRDHVDGGHLCTDLSSLMDQYINVAEQLTDEEDDGGDGGNDGDNGQNNGGSAFSGGPSNNDENKNSQPSSTSFSGFSFASSPAPPPSSGATTFSFTGGSAPAPAATTQSKPSFSFGAQPAATSGGSTSNPIAASEDDPTSNPDDGKLDIGQEENKDEETPYQVQARLVKLEGSGSTQAWKKLGTGVLRLYRNTITDKKKMVLRNDAGKVMFNVAVSKGMPFKKVSRKTTKGEVWNVSFAAVEDASEGLKQFMLNVKKEDIDKFHEELEKLAA